MKSATRRRLFALLFVVVLFAAACAPDDPDVSADPSDGTESLASDDETSAAHSESETDDPAAGATTDDPASGDESDNGAKQSTEAASGRVGLGAFDDYEPADPDPTPLPVDPEVLIGQLRNGLTYYVRSNDSPGGSVMMHLVVNAGAVHDPDGAQGTAHFLEHMMFNGTELYSKNELTQVLRDFGTEFGPDLNAFTSADRTLYVLDFLLDDPEALDLGLTVLSQWASAATLLPADVEAERGIVLDEYRIRFESAGGRISKFLDEIYFEGTAYEGMLLGGDEESIRAIGAADLREFYEAWYRPDNMAVVVVGDLPVREMEAMVQRHFEEMPPPPEAAPPQPDRSAFAAEFADEPVTDVVTHPDHGARYVSLDWQLPAWPRGTVGGERLRLMESLITDMLDIRLDAAFRAGQLSQATEPHFGTFAAAGGLRLWGTNFQGPDLAQATTDFLSAVHGAAHFGFTEVEFDQAVSAFETSLELELESDESRQDRQFSFAYASHFVSGSDISATADRVARRAALADTFTVDEMTAHLRWLLELAQPLAVSIGPDPSVVPTAAELRAAVDAAVPLAPPAAQGSIDALMARPDPIPPIADDALLLFADGHQWEFANGASVVWVPTEIAAGQVNVLAQGLGGWSTLSAGDSALVSHAVAAVVASGVGNASATQLDEYLADTTAGVNPFIAEHAEGFVGSAGSDDLEDLFALMNLLITEPRITEVAVNEQLQAMQTRLAYAETAPLWISELALLSAQHQDSPWYQFVATQDQIDATTPDSLLGLYEARFGDVDDLMVAVVGDIDAAAVADLAARYIGTLPAGTSDTFTDRHPGFPAGVQRITIPVAAGTGSAGLDIVFGVQTQATTRALVIADVTTAIINDLLIGQVREQLGDTYSVRVTISPEYATDRWDVRISASGPSDGLEASHASIISVLEELIANGPTDRDLQQAKSVTSDDYSLVNNGWYLDGLTRQMYAGEGNISPPLRMRLMVPGITAAEVQEHVALWFNLDNRIEVFRTES